MILVLVRILLNTYGKLKKKLHIHMLNISIFMRAFVRVDILLIHDT
jgi:hypothetical protein